MKKIIADVISRYGLSILRDEHRFCSIIDDLAPDKQDERKILHRMCYNHFLTYSFPPLRQIMFGAISCLRMGNHSVFTVYPSAPQGSWH